jgi:hypothetical protein
MQNPPCVHPLVDDFDRGCTIQNQFPPSSNLVQPSPPAQPTLQQMIAQLKMLREQEKQLAAAIREMIKAQRKAIDDAERDLNDETQKGNSIPSPITMPLAPR